MKTIFKYPQTGDLMSLWERDRYSYEFDIDMPNGARVLSVQAQGANTFIWALVDPEAPMTPRRFRLAGTGHPIEQPESWHYIGTWQRGPLVLHLFDQPSQDE